jgi:hypothetical protein
VFKEHEVDEIEVEEAVTYYSKRGNTDLQRISDEIEKVFVMFGGKVEKNSDVEDDEDSDCDNDEDEDDEEVGNNDLLLSLEVLVSSDVSLFWGNLKRSKSVLNELYQRSILILLFLVFVHFNSSAKIQC